MHDARPGGPERGHFAQPALGADAEWRAWTLAQLVFAVSLVVALVWALVVFLNSAADLPLESWQRRGLGFLILLGLVLFGVRSAVLAMRLRGRNPGR